MRATNRLMWPTFFGHRHLQHWLFAQGEAPPTNWEETMRKMILMAVAGFLWKKYKAHQAAKTVGTRHRRY